eukprot:g2264.t1
MRKLALKSDPEEEEEALFASDEDDKLTQSGWTTMLQVLSVFGRGGKGQLGVGPVESVFSPIEMTISRWSSESFEPVQAGIATVALGLRHTIVVLDDEKSTTYVWGDNKFGQLGHTGSFGVALHVPSTLYLPNRLRVIKVVAGVAHSVFLSEEGCVYTVGDGSQGQLGQRHVVSALRPRPVQSRRLRKHRVVDIASGAFHVVAVTDTRDVWAWGRGHTLLRGDPLGLGMRKNVFSPQRVKHLERAFAVSASCGERHTLFLDASNRVWCTGDNESGQLGLGDLLPRIVPTLLDLSFLDRVGRGPEARDSAGIGRGSLTIDKISCGGAHSAMERLNKIYAYQRLFQRFDTDGNNKMDAIELKDLFAAHGRYLNILEADKVIDEIDQDENHVIGENEFIDWMLDMRNINKRPGNFLMNVAYSIFYKERPKPSVGTWGINAFRSAFLNECKDLGAEVPPTKTLNRWFKSSNKSLRWGILLFDGVPHLSNETATALVRAIREVPIVQKIDLRATQVSAATVHAFLELVRYQHDHMTLHNRNCVKCDYRMKFTRAYRRGVLHEFLPCVRCAYPTARPSHAVHQIYFRRDIEKTCVLEIAKHDIVARVRISSNRQFRTVDAASRLCTLDEAPAYTLEDFRSDYEDIIDEYGHTHFQLPRKVGRAASDESAKNSTQRRQILTTCCVPSFISLRQNDGHVLKNASKESDESDVEEGQDREEMLDVMTTKNMLERVVGMRKIPKRMSAFRLLGAKRVEIKYVLSQVHLSDEQLGAKSERERSRVLKLLDDFLDRWTVSSDVANDYRDTAERNMHRVSAHFDTVNRMMRVAEVRCGSLHTVVRTQGGEVWTCGQYDGGQLGRGKLHETMVSMYKDAQREAHAEVEAKWHVEALEIHRKKTEDASLLTTMHQERASRLASRKGSIGRDVDRGSKGYVLDFQGQVRAIERENEEDPAEGPSSHTTKEAFKLELLSDDDEMRDINECDG